MAISFIQCTNLHKQWLNYFYLFLMINPSIFIQNYVNINNEILNDSCRLGRQISLQNKRCLWNTYVKIQVAWLCQILLDPAQIQTWLWSIIIKINLYAKYYISLSNICEEFERKLLVVRATGQHTDSRKAIWLPLLKGAHKIINITH